MATMQMDLLASGETRELTAPSRTELGSGAWFDHHSSWLPAADDLFDTMAEQGEWKTAPRPMYGKMVDVPRLVWWDDAIQTTVPRLAELRGWFEDFYARPLPSVSASWYRDGADSVAPHRDRFRILDDTVVVIVALGGRRPLVVRPDDGGPCPRIPLGHGDLFVMGGSFQATHTHGVPKQRHAEPRISVMFRS